MKLFLSYLIGAAIVIVVAGIAGWAVRSRQPPRRALMMTFRTDCRIVENVIVSPPDVEWWTEDGVHFAVHECTTVVWPACESTECWETMLTAASGPAFDARSECAP